MSTTAQTLKVDGQQLSLMNLTETTWDRFEAIIKAIPVGVMVHVNGVRTDLDDADIPAKMRGGLFSLAVRRGLLTPAITAEGYEIRAKSDGLSAHRATCRLYTRCAS